LKGILSVVFQMVGITYRNIRAHLLKLVPEPVVKSMETGFALVKTLITEGPMAAWEQLKEIAGELKDAFVEGVKNWIKWKVVEEAIKTVLALFVPGAGIVRAIIGIYDTVVFFIQKAKQIMQMIGSFLGSIAEIAAGNIGAAAQALEDGLARGLKLVIEFLARFLRLSGITQKIRDVIHGVRDKVDHVIAKVAKWIVDKGKGLFGSAKAAVARAAQWWKEKQPFRTQGGESHEVYYSGDEKNAVPMVASKDPKPVTKKLDEFEAQASAAQATAKEKGGKPTIKSARAAAKSSPADPNLVVHMKQLFEIYDEGSKETKITRKTGTLGGDTVGLQMAADWLGPNHPAGSPPQSGAQAKLMDLLVTDPTERSPDKFIRGHLLNEHLGGQGDAQNMFPITGNANSLHLHSTEKTVKGWIKPRQWVFYEVKVEGVSSQLGFGAKSARNYVNATFACHAVLKDSAGTVKEEFTTRIPSVFSVRQVAERTDKAG
jgi:hypothetical protein